MSCDATLCNVVRCHLVAWLCGACDLVVWDCCFFFCGLFTSRNLSFCLSTMRNIFVFRDNVGNLLKWRNLKMLRCSRKGIFLSHFEVIMEGLQLFWRYSSLNGADSSDLLQSKFWKKKHQNRCTPTLTYHTPTDAEWSSLHVSTCQSWPLSTTRPQLRYDSQQSL